MKRFFVFLLGMLLSAAAFAQDLRMAPDPRIVREAVVQGYGARALGFKGLFGVHTWVAVKPTAAPAGTGYGVIGWGVGWGRCVVVVRNRDPDGRWFGSVPELYAEKRG